MFSVGIFFFSDKKNEITKIFSKTFKSSSYVIQFLNLNTLINKLFENLLFMKITCLFSFTLFNFLTKRFKTGKKFEKFVVRNDGLYLHDKRIKLSKFMKSRYSVSEQIHTSIFNWWDRAFSFWIFSSSVRVLLSL